jgi:hypothetical protein
LSVLVLSVALSLVALLALPLALARTAVRTVETALGRGPMSDRGAATLSIVIVALVALALWVWA